MFNLTLQQWQWFFIAYFKLLIVQYKLRVLDRAWAIRELKKYQQKDLNGALRDSPSESACLSKGIAVNMHEAVRLAARCQLLSTQCLPKAFVLAQMLRHRGGAVEIRLGVSNTKIRQDTTSFASHAWVELHGVPIGEADNLESNFTRLTF